MLSVEKPASRIVLPWKTRSPQWMRQSTRSSWPTRSCPPQFQHYRRECRQKGFLLMSLHTVANLLFWSRTKLLVKKTYHAPESLAVPSLCVWSSTSLWLGFIRWLLFTWHKCRSGTQHIARGMCCAMWEGLGENLQFLCYWFRKRTDHDGLVPRVF